jgi:hypothetical protein
VHDDSCETLKPIWDKHAVPRLAARFLVAAAERPRLERLAKRWDVDAPTMILRGEANEAAITQVRRAIREAGWTFIERIVDRKERLHQIVFPQGKVLRGRIVGDSVYGSLRDVTPPTEYAPLRQFGFGGPALSDLTLTLRSSAGSPMLMAQSVSAALTAVDHDLVFTFQPMTNQVGASLTQERLVAVLSGFFGALALLLAGLGLHGVTSYGVNRRRTEIGIRMAPGAPPASVVRLVLWRVSMLAGAGLIVRRY